MKVLPQKGNKQPKYPRNKDICKTAAALVLTTSTLIGVSGCNGQTKPGTLTNGKANIPDATTTSEELIIEGEIGYEPETLECSASGRYAEFHSVYAAPETNIDLVGGETLVIGETTTYYRVENITIREIEDDSEFYSFFPKDEYFFYDSWGGNVIVISKSCSNCYVDYGELAGDVSVYGVYDISDYEIDSKGTTVKVESNYYDEPYIFNTKEFDEYEIISEYFYVAKNVSLNNIEEDSDFFKKFSKDEYDFYETLDNDIVIVKKDSNCHNTLPALGGVASPDDL